MPILAEKGRSWSEVAEMLDDPKRRHLVHPEDKQAIEQMGETIAELKKTLALEYKQPLLTSTLAEAVKKLSMHSDMQKAAQEQINQVREATQLALTPFINGPGAALIEQVRNATDAVLPKINLAHQIFENHISPFAQQAMEAHKHFEELRKSLAPPTESFSPRANMFSIEPLRMRQPYPSSVRINNPHEIAEILAEKMLQTQPQLALPPATEKSSALVESVYLGVELHLRILNFPVMMFEGLRANIIHFFYSDPRRGQWHSYRDMRHLGSTASVRHAIEDINERVVKETDNKVKELIASRQKGAQYNSSKEYRYAL